MRESDEQLFSKLKEGDSKSIERIYILYRARFFKWANQNFNSNHQDVEDAWQEAVLAFFENVRKERIQTLNCSINTYLFSVGRNILLNKHRKDLKTDLVGTFKEFEDPVDENFVFNFDNASRENSLMHYFESLGRKCKDLLINRFYLGKSVDALRQESGLNNNNVVSASLSRCLSRLRDLIKSNNISND